MKLIFTSGTYSVDLAVKNVPVILPADDNLRAETWWSNTVTILWC
jgi:hypothetical protein